ncbi:MAG: hypothetical protein J5I94_08285 [Phaeodactylibacter sp.]|nr:hypothetical protein [Phaeodactylibacter sp.]
MKITEIRFYDGAKEKIAKLGLASLFLEIQEIIFSTKVFLLEEKDSNGGAELRKLLDAKFEEFGEWEKTVSGGVDWKKRIRYNRSFIANIGVEVQVSARSDLLIRDIVHLRNSIQNGDIEAGVIIVPSDKLQIYLPDRTPSLRDAIKYIEEEFKEATTFPIIIIGIEHDGPGEALKKQKRKA